MFVPTIKDLFQLRFRVGEVPPFLAQDTRTRWKAGQAMVLQHDVRHHAQTALQVLQHDVRHHAQTALQVLQHDVRYHEQTALQVLQHDVWHHAQTALQVK
jgi:hypothetical protein